MAKQIEEDKIKINVGEFVEIVKGDYTTTIGFVIDTRRYMGQEEALLLIYMNFGFDQLTVDIHDIKKVQEPTKKCKNYKIYLKNKDLVDRFKCGSVHKLAEEIMVVNHSMFFTYERVLQKGTKIVVDWNPERLNRFNSAYKVNCGYKFNQRKTIFPWQVLCVDSNGKSCFEKIEIYDSKEGEFNAIPYDILAPYEFDKQMFEEQLILEDAIKERLKMIVKRNDPQLRKVMEVDWKMGGVLTKGKGTIILCFGPPGTGKTLTAEAISEYIGKPLYVITLDDLGNHPDSFERGMKRAFDIVKRWNGILLIDEVDNYITSRGNPTVDATLVSVMLRILEYFDGVLIMTTNRPVDIDEAIDSRIHLKIYYPMLKGEMSERIWKGLISNRVPIEGEIDWEKLSLFKLNGREIKTVVYNVISTALASGMKNIPANMFVEEAKYFIDGKNQLDSLRSKRKDKYQNPYDEGTSYLG